MVVSTLEVLWCLDLDEKSLGSSPVQSWSVQDCKVLLGMEISYGTEMQPRCSLVGPGNEQKKDLKYFTRCNKLTARVTRQ